MAAGTGKSSTHPAQRRITGPGHPRTGHTIRINDPRSTGLESDLKAVAEHAGLPYYFRLDTKPARQLGIPDLPGEIDLLADPATGRLWVIEAKNPQGAVAVNNVIQHVQRFASYCDKLLAKTAVIAANATAAAHACHVQENRNWQVIPLMVTRTVEPAAFLADPKVPFTIADHLAQILAASNNPRPGWNAPSGERSR